MKIPQISSKKAIKIALYILGVFAFQEIVFRYCYPLPELSNFDRSAYLDLSPNAKSSDYLRNKNFSWKSSPDTKEVFIHEMNSYGFRDDEWSVEKPLGKKRAIFIGDSFIEGVMAKQNETIPQAFRTSGKEDYEVFNAGMLGVGLDAYLQLAADMIPIFKPDVAFLCIYANDLGKTEPLVPQYFLEPEYYNKWTPRLYEIFKQMRTKGPLLIRWKNDAEPYFSEVPGKSNPWSKHEKELAGNVEPWLEKAMKEAEINPFLVNALQKEEIHLKREPVLGETIPFFQYTCKNNGTTPVVVYIPSRNQVSQYYYQFEFKMCTKCPKSWDLTTEAYNIHQKAISKQCQHFGVQFIDLTEVIRHEESKGNHLYWDYDQHMRAKGYKLLGETIRRIWDKNGTSI